MNRITLLQSDLERYLTTLTQFADPDLSAAQMQAVLDQAEARIAEVQQVASSERSLRLAAETARAAAQEETLTEREAALLGHKLTLPLPRKKQSRPRSAQSKRMHRQQRQNG